MVIKTSLMRELLTRAPFVALVAFLWLLSAVASVAQEKAPLQEASLQEAPLMQELPKDYQLGFQNAGTDFMGLIIDFNTLLLYVMGAIVALVMALLFICIVRFNARANPEPSKTSHNTLLEIIWTGIPVVILIFLTVPSIRLLYQQETVPPASMTIKVTGNQWYWSYMYKDAQDMSFDSVMLEDHELAPGQPRLLAVDQPVVVPVNTTVRVLITSSDVIHSWAVPAFGIKMDAVPGRLNETWFRANRTGIFYGQCSELCGVRHAFMPIEIRVVSKQTYQRWLTQAREKFSAAPRTKPLTINPPIAKKALHG